MNYSPTLTENMSEKTLQISEKPALLYFCALPQVIGTQTEKALLAGLPDYRREKAEKYLKSDDRLLSATAWHLLRYAVNNAYKLDAFSFSLAYDRFRKPFFAEQPEIHFNVSHCKGAVACALDLIPLGVDIEQQRVCDMAIARRVMPWHCDKLLSLKNSRQQNALFTRCWTETESIYKAGFTDYKANDNYRMYSYSFESYCISLCARQAFAPPALTIVSFDNLL